MADAAFFRSVAISLGEIVQRAERAIHRRPRCLLLLAGLLAIVAVAGCKKREVRVPVVPVSGKVAAFQGEIPLGAHIILRPVKSGGEDSVVPSARVTSDGSFVVGTHTEGDGAPPGKYAVTITWRKVVGDGPGPNVLPKKYASAATTPVIVTVNGPTEIPTIEFK